MSVILTLSFGLFGLSSRRILVQRCSGLKRFIFLIGPVTALPHITPFRLKIIIILKCLPTNRARILTRIRFTTRVRTLRSRLP